MKINRRIHKKIQSHWKKTVRKNKSPGKRVKKSHLRRNTTKKMVTSNQRMKISKPMRARKKSPMMRKTRKIKKTVQLMMSSRQRKARKNITTRTKTMKTSPLKAMRNAILVRREKNNLPMVKNNLPKVKRKNPARETTVKSSHRRTNPLRERKIKLAIGTKW
jgi:hypothetical protein